MFFPEWPICSEWSLCFDWSLAFRMTNIMCMEQTDNMPLCRWRLCSELMVLINNLLLVSLSSDSLAILRPVPIIPALGLSLSLLSISLCPCMPLSASLSLSQSFSVPLCSSLSTSVSLCLSLLRSVPLFLSPSLSVHFFIFSFILHYSSSSPSTALTHQFIFFFFAFTRPLVHPLSLYLSLNFSWKDAANIA